MKKQYTIDEFCTIHGSSHEELAWALANCKTMNDVWNKATPYFLVWIATRKGVLCENELMKFSVWCARKAQHLMKDPRSAAALDVAELYANGKATIEELFEVRKSVWPLPDKPIHYVLDSADAAARSASGRDNPDNWCDSAWSTSTHASVADANEYNRSTNEARKIQADWLRANVRPDFSVEEPKTLEEWMSRISTQLSEISALAVDIKNSIADEATHIEWLIAEREWNINNKIEKLKKDNE